MGTFLSALVCLLLAFPGRAGAVVPAKQSKPKKAKKQLTLKDLAPRFDLVPLPPDQVQLPPPLPKEEKPPYPSYYYPYYGGGFNEGWGQDRNRYSLLPSGSFVYPDAWRGDLKQEFSVQNGDLTRAAITRKSWGLTVEGGYLGAGANRNDITSTSPYLNVRKNFHSQPDSWVDWRLKLQAGWVQMKARYFNEDASADPQVDALLAKAAETAIAYGTPATDADSYLKYGHYPNAWQTTDIVVTSVLGQLGRAYSLFGPVDFGWTAGALLKTAHIFPNAAADLSAGPRVRLGEKSSIQLAGGVSENLSPAGSQLMQGFLADDPKWGLNHEMSPHASVTYRGPIPGEPGLHLGLTASRQWNLLTTANSIKGAIDADLGGKPSQLSATYRRETGQGIEFDREMARVDFSRRFTKSLTGSIGYQRENIVYGNAQVANQTYIAGLSWSFGGGDDSKATIEHVTNPKDTVSAPPIKGFGEAVKDLNIALGSVLSMAEAAQRASHLPVSDAAGDNDQNPERMRDLAASISAMTPVQRNALKLALMSQAQTPEQAQAINDAFTAQNQAAMAEILNRSAGLLDFFTDETILEKVAVRLARWELVQFLEKTEYPLDALGMKLRLTPGVLLAGVNILEHRGSPIQPLTAANQHDAMEPFIWRKSAESLGLPSGATPDEIAAAIIAKAPPEVRAQLGANGPAAIKGTVVALAELLRKEANMLVIQYMLAAEQFDRLSVDGGRRVGELSDDMMDYSFRQLDQRKLDKLFHGAIKLIESED